MIGGWMTDRPFGGSLRPWPMATRDRGRNQWLSERVGEPNGAGELERGVLRP